MATILKRLRDEVMILVAEAATRTLVVVVVEKTLVEMWRWKEGVGM